jgi:hypothetical protein
MTPWTLAVQSITRGVWARETINNNNQKVKLLPLKSQVLRQPLFVLTPV